MADEYCEAPRDAVEMLPDSPYMGAWDLGGKDRVVTIRDVKQVRLERRPNMPANQVKPIVFFVEKEKGLICGAKNMKALLKRFGSKDWKKDWIGKCVTIYPTTDAGKGGGIVDCVRIRPEPPKGKSDGPLADVPMDQAMARNQREQAGELAPREPGEEG